MVELNFVQIFFTFCRRHFVSHCSPNFHFSWKTSKFDNAIYLFQFSSCLWYGVVVECRLRDLHSITKKYRSWNRKNIVPHSRVEFSHKPDKITQCSPLSFHIVPYARLEVGVYLIIYWILKWMTSILTARPHMRLSASLISSSISVTWYDSNKFKLEF